MTEPVGNVCPRGPSHSAKRVVPLGESEGRDLPARVPRPPARSEISRMRRFSNLDTPRALVTAKLWVRGAARFGLSSRGIWVPRGLDAREH